MSGIERYELPDSVSEDYLSAYERLPNSKLDLVDAGHFTWEDAPDDYAELVTSWWARTR